MSQEEMHSGIVSPKGIWWGPVPAQEKKWIIISFIWCMVLFAAMPFWHLKGGQNVSGIRSKVEPSDFMERVERFIEENEVGELKGVPVVAPPPGSDIYLMGRMWSWSPILKLKKGTQYTLHISSVDVNHGLSIHPININFQIVPGYDYGLKIIPNKSGEYSIMCNEFCGVGHHNMVGKIIVED